MVIEFKKPFKIDFDFNDKRYVGEVFAFIPAYSMISDNEALKHLDLKESDEYFYNVTAPAIIPRYIMKKKNGYNVVIPQKLMNKYFRGD